MKKSNLLAGAAVLLATTATCISHVGLFATGMILFGILLLVLILGTTRNKRKGVRSWQKMKF